MTTTSEAVDLSVASLRVRHVPTNTTKAYTHDLRHFVATITAGIKMFSGANETPVS